MSIGRTILSRLLALRASAHIVAVYRIGYGILACQYLLQCLTFKDFLWYGSPYLPLSHGIFYLWLPVTLAIVIGFRTRICAVVHFVLTALILESPGLYPTVELIFFGMNAFWLMFLDASAVLSVDAWLKRRFTGAREDTPCWVTGWPVFLMGLCLSIQFLTSGLNKAFDPVWADGYGFYYTLLLPWLNPEWLNFLLNYEWLMISANYGGIAIECLVIVLYLIPRTRWLANLSFVGMGVMFTVVFSGLGFIGPLLLTLSLLLMSLDGPGTLWLRFAVDNDDTMNSPSPDCYPRHGVLSAVPVVILLLLAVQFCINILPHIIRLRYPVVYADVALSGHNRGSVRRTRDNTPRMSALLSQIDAYSTRTRWLWLFNTNHFFGTFEYKIIAYLEDGTRREPVKIFLSDGRRNPDIPLALMLQKRVIGEAAKSMEKYGTIEKTDFRRLQSILQYAQVRMSPEDRKQLRWLVIYVALVRLPETYAGNVQGKLEQPWHEFFAFNASQQIYALGRYEGLKNIRLKLKHSPEYVYFRLE